MSAPEDRGPQKPEDFLEAIVDMRTGPYRNPAKHRWEYILCWRGRLWIWGWYDYYAAEQSPEGFRQWKQDCGRSLVAASMPQAPEKEPLPESQDALA